MIKTNIVTKVPTTINSEDLSSRLSSLQGRIKNISEKKIGLKKELELLRNSHSQMLEELKTKGITDVKDLPKKIKELEEEINQKTSELEILVSDAESKLS
jgi:predicted  nucleic acid-binding Zn-ribbon protein